MKKPHFKYCLLAAALAVSACVTPQQLEQVEERQIDSTEKILKRLDLLSAEIEKISQKQKSSSSTIGRALRNQADIKSDLKQLQSNLGHLTGKEEEQKYYVQEIENSISALDERDRARVRELKEGLAMLEKAVTASKEETMEHVAEANTDTRNMIMDANLLNARKIESYRMEMESKLEEIRAQLEELTVQLKARKKKAK